MARDFRPTDARGARADGGADGGSTQDAVPRVKGAGGPRRSGLWREALASRRQRLAGVDRRREELQHAANLRPGGIPGRALSSTIWSMTAVSPSVVAATASRSRSPRSSSYRPGRPPRTVTPPDRAGVQGRLEAVDTERHTRCPNHQEMSLENRDNDVVGHSMLLETLSN